MIENNSNKNKTKEKEDLNKLMEQIDSFEEDVVEELYNEHKKNKNKNESEVLKDFIEEVI